MSAPSRSALNDGTRSQQYSRAAKSPIGIIMRMKVESKSDKGAASSNFADWLTKPDKGKWLLATLGSPEH